MVLAACFRLFNFAQWVKPALCCALMLFWISMSRLIFPFCGFGWREGLERPAIRSARAFFGVVHTQGFQTGEPFLIRCSGRDIFAALDLITFSLQATKQFFQIGTGWQETVDGRFQIRLIDGAILRGLMFNIALAFVLSGDDDGQTVFLCKAGRRCGGYRDNCACWNGSACDPQS